MRYRLLPPLMLLAALGGCASTPPPKPATPDAAQLRLNDAASSIQQSLRRLSEAEQYDKLKVAPNAPYLRRQFPGLERMVTMPWNGPLEPAVLRLAAEGGYEVKMLGRTPSVSIIVQIGPEAATIADHLRNLGVQSGVRADVAISPQTGSRKGLVVIEYPDGGL